MLRRSTCVQIFFLKLASHRPIKRQSRLWSQRGTKVNGCGEFLWKYRRRSSSDKLQRQYKSECCPQLVETYRHPLTDSSTNCTCIMVVRSGLSKVLLPCAGGLLANAIGTQLRKPINSGPTLSMISIDDIDDGGCRYGWTPSSTVSPVDHSISIAESERKERNPRVNSRSSSPAPSGTENLNFLFQLTSSSIGNHTG